MVAELINETTSQWNEELIGGVFASDEATMIKKIPLGKVALEDVLIWPHIHDGRYTCKSGYRFLKAETKLQLGMAIFARPVDTRPGLTLMGRVLPDPFRNRVGYGFKKKNLKRVRVGYGFY